MMLTIGEILMKEREKRNLTLGQVEKVTKIRQKNLEAVEKNEWIKFPSKTYIIGIIKTYGKFLNLNEEKLIAFFRRQYEKNEQVQFKERVSKSHLTPQTKKIFKLSIVLIFLLFCLYFGYQLMVYFSPPRVEIISPKEAVFQKEEKIKLIGKTEKEAIVNINGERVYQNQDNIFEFIIPLINPKNEVIIEVTGANGRKTMIKKIFEKKN